MPAGRLEFIEQFRRQNVLDRTQRMLQEHVCQFMQNDVILVHTMRMTAVKDEIHMASRHPDARQAGCKRIGNADDPPLSQPLNVLEEVLDAEMVERIVELLQSVLDLVTVDGVLQFPSSTDANGKQGLHRQLKSVMS